MVYKTDETFTGVNFSAEDIAGSEFENCTFDHCTFAKADLSRVLFIDCAFLGCDMSLATITRTAFRSVSFDSCKLLGLRFEDASDFAFECSFSNSQLDLCTFISRDLRYAKFHGCSLKETDFAESNLSGVDFAGCDLRDAVFEGTNLERADFRSAYNYSIDPDVNRMSKAKFSVTGLSGLLRKYDIEIEP